MDIYGIGYRDGLTDGLKQSAQQRDDLLAAAKSANAMLAEIVSEHSDDFYPEETSAIIERVKQINAAIAKAEADG